MYHDTYNWQVIVPKQPDKTFSVALEYVKKTDISHVTVDNIEKFIHGHMEWDKWKGIYDKYLKDPRLHGSNEHYYATCFTIAVRDVVERNVTGQSSYEIVRKMILTHRHEYAQSKKWLKTTYPEALMDMCLEELKARPLQFNWTQEESDQTFFVMLFGVAWHEDEPKSSINPLLN